MKLAFNAMNSGLGNNGGSRTVLLCCKELERLGHDCDVIGTVDNFTWFEHKPMIPYFPSDIEWLIATSCHSVSSTLQAGVKNKAWYIRGHETWTMDEGSLIKLYKDDGFINIVNSFGLKKLLEMYEAESFVVHQGIDMEKWQDRSLRPENKIRIGALYTGQNRKRWSDFVKLSKILGSSDYEYVSIGNSRPPDDFLTKSVHNVDYNELCDLYSSCHIWFAPTDSEGLHNVPMEAALCGCLIVSSNAPLNGMLYDYAFPGETAMVYQKGDIEGAADLIRNPDWDLIHNMRKHIVEKIGDRRMNMMRLVKLLENKSG